MKQFFSAAVFIAGLALDSGVQAAGERIGTYDSRAIAVAYAGSPVQQKLMAPLRAAHQAAKLTDQSKKQH